MSDLAAIEEVDDLDDPNRGDLGMVTIRKVVARAARSALDRARLEPEDALSHLRARVSGLYTDFTSVDGWARMGAVEGSLAGWSGYYYTPTDCPSQTHWVAFCHAWAYAWGVVWGVRHGG